MFDAKQKNLVREALVAWAVVIFVSGVCYHLQDIPLIAGNLALITAVLLLYIPLGIHLQKREKISYFDQNFQDVKNSVSLFFLTSIVIFPLTFFVNHLYQQGLGHSYHGGILPDVWRTLVTQVVLVALPEEFFFRGYLQGRLRRVCGKTRLFLGAPVGFGLVLTAVIFAVSHSLITYQWWHILIFFPAMVFGWLKEKTGTVFAPVLFHAACNVFAYWVGVHYF